MFLWKEKFISLEIVHEKSHLKWCTKSFLNLGEQFLCKIFYSYASGTTTCYVLLVIMLISHWPLLSAALVAVFRMLFVSTNFYSHLDPDRSLGNLFDALNSWRYCDVAISLSSALNMFHFLLFSWHNDIPIDQLMERYFLLTYQATSCMVNIHYFIFAYQKEIAGLYYAPFTLTQLNQQ